MNHEKWFDLAAGYAVGSLEEKDRADFEIHLKQCEECMNYFADTDAALSLLLKALPLETPSLAAKARVMEAINEESLVPAGADSPAWNPFWAAAGVWAFAALLFTFAWNHTSGKRHAHEFERIEKSMMAQPEAKIVKLDGLEQAKGSTARMMWNASEDCVFMTWGLPKASRDKVYELWGVIGNKTVPAGIFVVDEHGCGRLNLKLKDFKPHQFEKIAVTLEPSGGVPKPTGPMVLLGSL